MKPGRATKYTVTPINFYDCFKEDEMGRACSTHGSEEDCIQGWKARRKETTRKT
jgi:hypothetical protein